MYLFDAHLKLSQHCKQLDFNTNVQRTISWAFQVVGAWNSYSIYHREEKGEGRREGRKNKFHPNFRTPLSPCMS